MVESFSTLTSESPVNAKSREPESLNPFNSSLSHEDLSCMNMPLGSELSSTYSDSVWIPEVSSSDKSGSDGGVNLNLDLDLTLRINHVYRKHTVAERSPAIAVGMEQARIAPARDFQFQTLNGEANNNDMYSDSRSMGDAVFAFKRNYFESILGHSKRVQCSASVTSKENQQELSRIIWNEDKHWPFSSNPSRLSWSSDTNHSGMASVDELCNLSRDQVCQLSNFDTILTVNHFTYAGDSSTSTMKRKSLCPFPNPSEENQEGAMAGSFVRGQGNSLYIKVKMDGMPIGRKLDLNAYESYETLAQVLENMFQRTTEDVVGSSLRMRQKHAVKPLRLLDPAADFVLTYEDTEGDCMLVGDIPWKMFIQTAKRLRIIKNSGSNVFAQKCSVKRKAT